MAERDYLGFQGLKLPDKDVVHCQITLIRCDAERSGPPGSGAFKHSLTALAARQPMALPGPDLLLTTTTRPPCNSAMPLTSDRPIPSPPSDRPTDSSGSVPLGIEAAPQDQGAHAQRAARCAT
jgi:hypothetical protein